jgi:hypothetical protein
MDTLLHGRVDVTLLHRRRTARGLDDLPSDQSGAIRDHRDGRLARRSPGLGGLIASLPLVSILAMIWLWQDTADTEHLAAQSEATFWFVLPSLPMFLIFPAMIRHGLGFWAALTLSCILTMGLYSLTIRALSRFGIQL